MNEPPIGGLIVAPQELWSIAEADRQIAFVDLDRLSSEATFDRLPPFPLIGIGDPAHPLAERLDAVVEAPISTDSLVTSITRAPKAAAVVVELLRIIPEMNIAAALTAESLAFAMLQKSAEHQRWLASRMPKLANPAGEVIVERKDDRLRIVIDRPPSNEIDAAMRDALHGAFTLAALDDDIRYIRLEAAGRAFGMGADLSEFGTTRDPASAHLIRARTLPALAIGQCADRLEAHVQGGCVGSSLEMVASAKRLTATADAWFQLPELSMGILPGAGGCVSVSRRIGRQHAALMILSGRRISAATALKWGLIDAIVDELPGDQGRSNEI